MNEKKLKHLLGKYYDGDSTKDEERILKEYFTGGEVMASFEAEKEIFGYYQSSLEIPEPSEGFESRILRRIDNESSNDKIVKIRKQLYPFLAVAASIMVIAGAYFFFRGSEDLNDTYSDPQIAYQETRKILFDVSSKMNKAANKLEPVGKISEMRTKSFSAINRSTEIIERNLESLKGLEPDRIENN